MTMPAPIPITRVADPSSSSSSASSSGVGSYRMGTSYGNSFPSSNSAGGSASFREAMMMATSFGKDVNDLMDYSTSRFGSSVDSEMTIAPSTSQPRLESTFCRDFSCCGQELDDLHDLLQHYEECHVRFDDDGMPGMVEDDGSSSAGSASTPSSVPPSPRAPHQRAATAPGGSKLGGAGPAGGNHKRLATDAGSDASGVNKGKKRSFGQYDASSNGSASVHQSLRRALIDGGVGSRSGRSSPSVYSANRLATDAGSDASGVNKGKKRSFGQYDASSNGSASVHQSLRRALIDGGVGSRSGRSSPSVYSANSPFSTPGSSIPGTPVGEDHDFAFAGPGGLSAFSALSLRQSSNDDHLPACAPPNLFFPAPGSSSGAGANATTPGMPGLNLPSFGNVGNNGAANSGLNVAGSSAAQQPPAKRERMTSSNGAGPSGGASGGSSSNAMVGPGGEKLDKDGKPIEKPFKCPNPGCDKAYKQANGLKYHRLHGSCNRNLAGKQSSQGDGPSTPTPSGSKGATSPSTPSPVAGNAALKTGPAATAPTASKPAVPQGNAVKSPQPPQPPKPAGSAPALASAIKKPGAPAPGTTPAAGSNGNSPAPFPLPPNINSAALAAAAALLQRGGPLPPSLQGSNGPIDTASLLKTLQMLQAQVAAQQKANGGAAGAAGTAGAAGAARSPPTTGAAPSRVAPGAPMGAASATTATSGAARPPAPGQARPPPPRPSVPGAGAGAAPKPAGAGPAPSPAALQQKKASPTVGAPGARPPPPPAGAGAGQQKPAGTAGAPAVRPQAPAPSTAQQQQQKK